MICPECGTENNNWALHCKRCQTPLPRGMDRWLFAGAILVGVAVFGIILTRMGVISKVLDKIYAIEFFPEEDTPVPEAELADPEVVRLLPLPNQQWEYQEPQNLSESDSNARALVAMGHKEKLAFGTVLVEPTDLSSEGLASLALDRLKLRAEEFRVVREVDINLGGVPSRRADFIMEMGGLMIRYMATYAVNEQKGYQILFWCLDSDYPEFEPQFTQSLESWSWAH